MTDLDPEVPSSPKGLEGFSSLSFFVADFAAVENGKVYASGAFWSHLRFPSFPIAMPYFSIVAVVKVPWHAQHSDHVLSVNLVDSDEAPLPLEIKGEFRTAPAIEAKYGEPGVMPLAFPVSGFQFEKPGTLSFVLRVDGAEIDRYTVNVLQVPMQPMG